MRVRRGCARAARLLAAREDVIALRTARRALVRGTRGLESPGVSARVVAGEAAERPTKWATAIRIGEPGRGPRVAALVCASGSRSRRCLRRNSLAWPGSTSRAQVFGEPDSEAGSRRPPPASSRRLRSPSASPRPRPEGHGRGCRTQGHARCRRPTVEAIRRTAGVSVRAPAYTANLGRASTAPPRRALESSVLEPNGDGATVEMEARQDEMPRDAIISRCARSRYTRRPRAPARFVKRIPSSAVWARAPRDRVASRRRAPRGVSLRRRRRASAARRDVRGAPRQPSRAILRDGVRSRGTAQAAVDAR